MLKEAPGPINFTVFLTMFGEKLKGEQGCRYMILHYVCRDIFFFFINSELPLFLFRCWPRGDYPQCFQSLWPWGNRDIKERLVSKHLEFKSLVGCPVCSPSLLVSTVWQRCWPPKLTGSLLKRFVLHFWQCSVCFFNSVKKYAHFMSSQMEQMFAAFPPDVAGNLDYKNLVYVITHGEEKDQE